MSQKQMVMGQRRVSVYTHIIDYINGLDSKLGTWVIPQLRRWTLEPSSQVTTLSDEAAKKRKEWKYELKCDQGTRYVKKYLYVRMDSLLYIYLLSGANRLLPRWKKEESLSIDLWTGWTLWAMSLTVMIFFWNTNINSIQTPCQLLFFCWSHVLASRGEDGQFNNFNWHFSKQPFGT